MRVEGQFGWFTVNGTRYEHDIIIHADGSVTGRSCGCSPSTRGQLSEVYLGDYFHAPLTEGELGFLQEERPEVVVIGAGYRGMMPLTPRAKAILAEYEHKVLSTPGAIEHLGTEARSFVAVLHSTC
jgi:hypothetical protein